MMLNYEEAERVRRERYSRLPGSHRRSFVCRCGRTSQCSLGYDGGDVGVVSRDPVGLVGISAQAQKSERWRVRRSGAGLVGDLANKGIVVVCRYPVGLA